MPIGYHDGEITVISDRCPECEQPAYDSGCDAPGCTGLSCQDCGWGCDLDFAGDDSRCAQAALAEDLRNLADAAPFDELTLAVGGAVPDPEENPRG